MNAKVVQSDRKTYLGGSDIAAILGLSRYRTALQVWAEKVGAIEPEDAGSKMAVRVGRKMEAVVAELFEEETGKKLRRVNRELAHPQHDFLRGHVDREVIGEKAVVEIKTAGAWLGQKLEEGEVPDEHLAQTLYYVAIGGYERAYVACLIGNNDLRIKPVERDQALIRDIVGKAVEFWEKYVVANVMPMTISRHDADTLLKLFPGSEEDSEVVLDGEAEAIIERLRAHRADLRVLEGQKEQAENELKALLKDNTIGRTTKHVVTWRPQVRKNLDAGKLKAELPEVWGDYSRETRTRVLRITDKKEVSNGDD